MRKNRAWLGLMVLLFILSSCVNREKEIRKELKLGIKLMYIGRQTEAIEHFENVIEMDSTEVEAYLNLGRTYYNQGKYDLAMKQFNRCIHFKPDYGEAYRSRGLLWKALGDHDKFCADYIKAEDLGVKNLTNYTSKCRAAHLHK